MADSAQSMQHHSQSQEQELRQNEEGEEEQEDEMMAGMGMGSIYPPVPNLYKRFTKTNINRLEILQNYQLKQDEPAWELLSPEDRIQRQNQILSKERKKEKEREGDGEGEVDHSQSDDEPLNFDLLSEMQPPRADWIQQDGYYHSFGDRWPIPDIFPTLQESGIQQLYPKSESQSEPIDRREILLTLLKTLLSTHLSLTTTLLSPPNYYQVTNLLIVGPPIQKPDGSWEEQLAEEPSERCEAMDKWEHIRTVVINFQHLINECRPMQARETLKQTLKSQVERRRAQTQLLKSKSQEMKEQITKMRESMGMVDPS